MGSLWLTVTRLLVANSKPVIYIYYVASMGIGCRMDNNILKCQLTYAVAVSVGCKCPPPPRLGKASPALCIRRQKGGIGYARGFLAFLLLSQVSSMYYLVRGLMLPPLYVDVAPPRYCDFLEGLVVVDGIKTLGLHLRANCKGVGLLIFESICFRPSYYYVYRQSHPYKITYYLCFESVLRWCTMTESKCSPVTGSLKCSIINIFVWNSVRF